MASINNSSVAGGEETKEHSQLPSPRTFRRTWSASSSTCGHGGAQGGPPKCVCAPATHAGSFKCRLHRTNSQTHHHSSAPMPRGPSSAVNSSRTVEAQQEEEALPKRIELRQSDSETDADDLREDDLIMHLLDQGCDMEEVDRLYCHEGWSAGDIERHFASSTPTNM